MADAALFDRLSELVAAAKAGSAALDAALRKAAPRELFELMRLASTKAGTSEVRRAAAPLLAEALSGSEASELLGVMGGFGAESLGPEDPGFVRVEAAVVQEAPLIERDICVIGGGVSGAIIARDAGSCGYSSVLVEQRHCVGGVWERNNYPGLRLHGFASAYRCMSLAPPWQVRPHATEGDHVGDIMYRPTCVELRE